MSSERALLAISRQADWVPRDGQVVGAHSLRVSRAATLEEASVLSDDRTWDVVAFDVACVRPVDGTDALACLREIAPDATFLAVTDRPDVHEAIAFLKQGVYEYLEEPLSFDAFLTSVAEAIANRDAYREIQNLNRSLEAQTVQLLKEKTVLEKRNRELEAISLVARAVSSSLELEEILGNLARCIRETFGFERILIGVLDGSRTAEKVQVVVGSPDSQREELRRKARWSLREARRQPWIDAVLKRGETLRVTDPASHPLTAGTLLEGLHPGPFVKIPMTAKGQIVGSITIDNPASGRPVDDDEMGVLTIFADSGAMAVENARLYQTMKELSVRDELTGLFNRRHFLRQLEAEWNHAARHGMSMTLLMLDVDHFKSFNDLNDHLTGDAALRRVADLLTHNTRGIDTVARYGGEEFVVILPRTSKPSAKIVADKLRGAVAAAVVEGEEVLPGGCLTVSVGLATYPGDATTPLELVERADWALYRAKAGGRNRVIGWEEDDAEPEGDAPGASVNAEG